MDIDVFQAFPEGLSTYTFLRISRGGITGNTIVSSHEATGIFKLRSDLVRGENSETKESNATMHVRPTEPFLAAIDNNLVGHGIRVEGKDYEVVGFTGGDDYHFGDREHYTATLQETSFANFEES